MAISVNLTGVKTVFEPLPQGYYQAVVQKCEQVMSKNNNPMIKWTFSITEPEEFLGRNAWMNTMLTGDGRFALKLVLMALGMGTEESLTGDITFEEEDMLGLPCTLALVPDVYEGKTNHKVDKVLEAGIEE